MSEFTINSQKAKPGTQPTKEQMSQQQKHSQPSFESKRGKGRFKASNKESQPTPEVVQVQVVDQSALTQLMNASQDKDDKVDFSFQVDDSKIKAKQAEEQQQENDFEGSYDEEADSSNSQDGKKKGDTKPSNSSSQQVEIGELENYIQTPQKSKMYQQQMSQQQTEDDYHAYQSKLENQNNVAKISSQIPDKMSQDKNNQRQQYSNNQYPVRNGNFVPNV